MTADTLAISVVIPVFDAARTIDVQLAALAAQRDLPPWEVIVADNGSNDDSVARAERWRSVLPLTVVDASARRGPSAARNEGAARARGDVLLFCDADDAAEPGWVRAFAEAMPQADAAAGSRRYDLLNDREFGPADWPAPIFSKEPLVGLAAASSHNLAVRRAVFEAVGGFDEGLAAAEDIDLCWRIQLAGHAFVAVPEASMQIRRRVGLAAIGRQAYAYGRGDRLLAVKYADVQAGRDTRDAPGPLPAPGGHATPTRRSLRLRLPDPEFHVHRLGYRLGRRFGGVDVSVAPLPPRPQESS